MYKKMLAALAVSTIIVAPASAANILTNGSFEDGLNGWNFVNNEQPGNGASVAKVIETGVNTPWPNGAFGGETIPADNAASNPNFDNAGNHVLYFSSDTSNAPTYFQSVSQDVSLYAGKSYTFGFDIYKTLNGDRNPNDATFTAMLGDEVFATFTASALEVGKWVHYSSAKTFDADMLNSSFTFIFNSNGYTAKDFAIDRVYLAQTDSISPVPEPATWGLLILGFGMIGLSVRRRNVRTTVRFA